MRLFILSDSPPEKDVQWSDTGMLAAYKFIQKIYALNEKIKQIIKKEKTKSSNNLSKFINQYLIKIERNLSNFQYNVIIANIHEACTFLTELTKKEENFSNLEVDYRFTSAEKLAQNESESFDIVTCLEMLEHVPNPELVVSACFNILDQKINFFQNFLVFGKLNS